MFSISNGIHKTLCIRLSEKSCLINEKLNQCCILVKQQIEYPTHLANMIIESPSHLESEPRTNFSQKAKNEFSSLDISFLPGSFKDIYRITSRDMQGGSYPYNAGFSDSEKTRKDWIITKDGVEIGFYYTGLKKDKKTGKEIGEVGMIHLAPEIRDKGLFTPIYLLGLMQLLEDGAGELRSVVGDETGKVEGVNQKLGFEKTGKTFGCSNQPVWEMDILSSQEKLHFFMQEFEKKISRLKKEGLSFAPEVIDIDNPKRVSIAETVLSRLEQEVWNSGEEERVLFGYPKAPVLLFQKRYDMLLRVPKESERSRGIFEKSIKAVLPDFNTSEIYTFPTDILESDFEIEFTNLRTEDEAKKAAQKLSEIGRVFSEETNAGTKLAK